MNKKILIYLIGLVFLGSFALADTFNNVAVSEGTPGTATLPAQGSAGAEGGNVTNVNLTGDATTDKWQGYYGNVSGSLVLGDGANTLFNFGTPSFVAVYAASGQAITFGGLSVVDTAPERATHNTQYNFGAAADNSTNVISAAATCAAGTEIAAANGYTTLNSTASNSTWETCVAFDTSETVDEYVYGTDIVTAGSDGFDGNLWQFQLMVPVNLTQTYNYYFWLEF